LAALTLVKFSESKTVFNIFGSQIKEWWDLDQLLEDQVEPLIFVGNTGESSHKKKSLMAEKISQVFRNSTKKINYLFPMVQEL
jgi:hypothetical protein